MSEKGDALAIDGNLCTGGAYQDLRGDGLSGAAYRFAVGLDLDADGDTDQSDLGILLARYGAVRP